MFKISQTCFTSWPRVWINYSHESESVSFSLQVLKFNLSAVVLPIMLKADFNFELILYIVIFVFLSPGSCFKSVICIQNSLESASIVLFSSRLKEGKLFTRKVWGLYSHWSSILRPPKHLFMFSLSILSAKEVICPFKEWKQDSGSL